MQVENLGLINLERNETDYIFGQEQLLGGSSWTPKIKEIDGVVDWTPYEPEYEYQWKSGVETNACVSFSCNNVCEYLTNYEIANNESFRHHLEINGLLEKGKANFSDRRTAKGSGTDPNNGNGFNNVMMYVHYNGFCPESKWPFTDGMSRDEFYAIMTEEIRDFGKKHIIPNWEMEFKYWPVGEYFDRTKSWSEHFMEALTYSPIWVSVKVPYIYDGEFVKAEQSLINAVAGGDNRQYGHAVMIRKGVRGKYFEVHDNYLKQIIKFPWNYPFGGKLVGQIVKKKVVETAPHIIKNGAIATLGLGGKYKGQYLPWTDGDHLKFIYGDYGKAIPRKEVAEWPENYNPKKALKIVDNS